MSNKKKSKNILKTNTKLKPGKSLKVMDRVMRMRQLCKKQK